MEKGGKIDATGTDLHTRGRVGDGTDGVPALVRGP